MNQHQTRLAVRPLALPAAANDQLQDRPLVRAGLTFLTLQNTCGAAMPRHFHSHRLPNSLRLSRKRACLFLPVGQACAYSISATGSRLATDHTLLNQQLLQNFAGSVHLKPSLSSSLVSVGIDPNENGLTHEARSLSPDDKIHD